MLHTPRRVLPLAAASLLLASLPVGLLSAADARVGRAADPSLPHAAHGQQAIQLLGDQLDEAAALNGLSAAKLRAVLSADPTAWVDVDGRVYYVEPVAKPAGGSVAPPQEAAPFPLGHTFFLHSRPTSTHKLFIDFDGSTVSGTAWNASGLPNGFYPGYSLDGDPATFTAAEQEDIQKIWQRVAEDYAPFDVDVTTEDPGAAAIDRTNGGDQNFGTRALVSHNTTASAAVCNNNCGGIAYLGVFDEIGADHNYYQPAWVFGHLLGNNNKSIGEAVSHEVGHNFGLNHDGRTSPAEGYYYGHDMWAPIMGVGYNRPVVQWSKGEYASANNTENDLNIIAAGGAPVIADEAGSTVGAAAAGLLAKAYITSAADKDTFSLGTCNGAVTVNATGAPPSQNLDIQLELLDSAGTTVATDNPTSAFVSADSVTGLNASVSVGVGAGSYYARVDGVGNGTASTGYTDYGSIGGYTLSVSGCFGQTVPAEPQFLDVTTTRRVPPPR